MTHRYRQRILDQLSTHGLRPRASTPPRVMRDYINDLYVHEIRRLRRALRAGEFPLGEYSSRVVDLRRRYWLLSVRTDEWLEPHVP